jgi:precorrin-6Y C5,15-methyltransferase (decarboxylating)
VSAGGGARITVVGIGAEGWDGLSERARSVILAADVVVGSGRQLSTLPAEGTPPHWVWPSPLVSMLDDIVAREDGAICVLASGDPLHYGIGATLARRLGTDAVQSGRLSFISQPSAFSLACARLGWPADEVQLMSTVGRPASAINRLLQPGRRIIVYVAHEDGAVQIAATLVASGYGASTFVVLEELGAEHEKVTFTTAADWGERSHDMLTTVAVEIVPDDPDQSFYPTTPGLPDHAYENDGALTKRHVRASTLAMLEPSPGQLLWDIGAGSGSIAIEWLRAEPTARAIAIEADPVRATRIGHNAERLGVPELHVMAGPAPDVLQQLSEAPDAIFIGGGLSSGVLDIAWDWLVPGGRLVANAVTIESEKLLLAARAQRGGELIKLSVSSAEPLGGFEAWRPALPIVQWAVRKP